MLLIFLGKGDPRRIERMTREVEQAMKDPPWGVSVGPDPEHPDDVRYCIAKVLGPVCVPALSGRSVAVLQERTPYHGWFDFTIRFPDDWP